MKNLSPGQSWIHHARMGPSPRLRLFCLPHAGGSAAMYRGWGHWLPANVDLCPIQLPGRENRFREPVMDEPAALVAALCAALTPLLDRPYVLFGYSMGGVIAHALAQGLRQRNLPQPEQLMVAACAGPDQSAAVDPDTLDDRAFIAYLKRLGGTPTEVLEHQELMELMLPLLRGDFRLLRRLRQGQQALPLDMPIVALAGQDDAHATPMAIATWAHCTRAGFRALSMPGGHFAMLREPRSLVARIVEQLPAPIGI